MLELLEIARNTGINLCLVSSAGTGKSTIVETFAKEKGIHCETLIISNMESTELVGIPYINKDETGSGSLETAKPEWLKNLEKHGGNGILFIDEVSNARPDVQTPLLTMLTARKAGVYDIPKDVQFVFAMNDSASAVDYYDMGEALRDRLCFVEHRFTKKDFKKVFSQDDAIVQLMDYVNPPRDTRKINVQDYVVESYRTYGNYVNALLKYIEKVEGNIKLRPIKELLMGMLNLDNANATYNYICDVLIPTQQAIALAKDKNNYLRKFFEQYSDLDKMYSAYLKLSAAKKEQFDMLLNNRNSKIIEIDPWLSEKLDLFQEAIVTYVFASSRSARKRFVSLNEIHNQLFNDYLYTTKIDSVSKERFDQVCALYKQISKQGDSAYLGNLVENQTYVENAKNSEELTVNLIDLYVHEPAASDKVLEYSKKYVLGEVKDSLINFKNQIKNKDFTKVYLGLDRTEQSFMNFYFAKCFIDKDQTSWSGIAFKCKDIINLVQTLEKNNESYLLGELEEYIVKRWTYMSKLQGGTN